MNPVSNTIRTLPSVLLSMTMDVISIPTSTIIYRVGLITMGPPRPPASSIRTDADMISPSLVGWGGSDCDRPQPYVTLPMLQKGQAQSPGLNWVKWLTAVGMCTTMLIPMPSG